MHKLLYRLRHPLTWHMRWQPKEFRADLHSPNPGIYWQDRFFPALRWQDHADAWQGGTGILCAAGPSLGELAGFAEVQSKGSRLVGVNGGIRLRDREGIRFDLMMMTDPNMAHLQWDNLVEAFETSHLLVISPKLACAVCQRDPDVLDNKPFLLVSQPHEAYGQVRPSRRLLAKREARGELLNGDGDGDWRLTGFSFDPSWGVFAGGTVTVAAIQVLAYFGLSRIAVAGMDLSGGQHFYAEAAVKPSRLSGDYATRIEPALRTAARAGEQRGFELLNLSPASRLPEDIIPKCSADVVGLRPAPNID